MTTHCPYVVHQFRMSLDRSRPKLMAARAHGRALIPDETEIRATSTQICALHWAFGRDGLKALYRLLTTRRGCLRGSGASCKREPASIADGQTMLAGAVGSRGGAGASGDGRGMGGKEERSPPVNQVKLPHVIKRSKFDATLIYLIARGPCSQPEINPKRRSPHGYKP